MKYHSFPSISFSHPCWNLLAPKNNYLARKGNQERERGGGETSHKAAAFFLINEFALQFCEGAGRLGWGVCWKQSKTALEETFSAVYADRCSKVK